jgi:hypothetical protein
MVLKKFESMSVLYEVIVIEVSDNRLKIGVEDNNEEIYSYMSSAFEYTCIFDRFEPFHSDLPFKTDPSPETKESLYF